MLIQSGSSPMRDLENERDLLEEVGLAVDSGGNNEALAASEGWGIGRDQN
jgi:hypothetical protein